MSGQTVPAGKTGKKMYDTAYGDLPIVDVYGDEWSGWRVGRPDADPVAGKWVNVRRTLPSGAVYRVRMSRSAWEHPVDFECGVWDETCVRTRRHPEWEGRRTLTLREKGRKTMLMEGIHFLIV